MARPPDSIAADSVAEFQLSITKALADQLEEKLATLRPAPLNKDRLDQLAPNRPGVYVLYKDGERVYVGKAKTSVQQRLGNHLRKISGRTNISLSQITFIALYMHEDLDSVAPERQLMTRFDPPWNYNGFGNKDPGRRRDLTLVKSAHFDATYPINLRHQLTHLKVQRNLGDFIRAIKAELPFLLRFERKLAAARLELRSSAAPQVPESIKAEDVFGTIVEALSPNWQLTALPGYAVLYPTHEEYPSAIAWWRLGPDGRAFRTKGAFRLAPGAVAVESDDDNGSSDESVEDDA
jgi:hypothetical protein